MRTTLKRGTGRGAHGNGNGHATLPPGVLTPMARYRQPEPESRSLLRTLGSVVLWLLVAVLMVVGAVSGGAYLYAQDAIKATAPKGANKEAAKRLAPVASPDKPTITLVVGSDHRFNVPGASRSDTLMLIRTDPATKIVSMLSLPRDLRVPIICPRKDGSLANYGPNKINSAFALCGPKGTVETVKALTHLSINYLISVNFVGFIQVVNELGGVWLDVDRRYYHQNQHTLDSNYANINLQPGYQRLGGQDALDFVRYRHTDSDLYRVARQQMFVRAVKERVARFPASRILGIVKALKNNVEIGRAGGNGVTLDTLRNYAFFFYHLPPGHFFQVKIAGLSGPTDLSTDPSNITSAVQSFANPDAQAAAKAYASALGERFRPRRVGLNPASISVTVLNGNGVPNSAGNGNYLLRLRGYHTVAPPPGQSANAPNWNYVRSLAYYDPQQPQAKAAAAQVARLVGQTDVAPLPLTFGTLANGAQVVLVLGQSFHNTLALPPVVDTTPTRQPPAVVTNPSATLGLVRGVRGRVPFRLEVPHVLGRSSSPDYELPIRVYPIGAGHKAVRLVFSTGSPGDFWGIEETNWNDAPVLSERNIERHLGGRTYDFYYSGPRLHMVVLRENGASYWVVNTLSDQLSNETMLAIARGLHPLQ